MNRIKFGSSFIAWFMAFGVYSSALAHEGHDDGKASRVITTITEEDIEYGPEEQTVHVGQPIRVVNKDIFEHKSRVTRQLPGGALGEIVSLGLMVPSAFAGKDVGGMKRTEVSDHVDKPGASFTFKLDKPDTYQLRCMLHDGMTATIKAVKTMG